MSMPLPRVMPDAASTRLGRDARTTGAGRFDAIGPDSSKARVLHLCEAARFRGIWALLSVLGSCYEEPAGCVVAVVREAVSDAA